MPKKLTQEEFEIRIHNIDPSFRVIGKYNGYQNIPLGYFLSILPTISLKG